MNALSNPWIEGDLLNKVLLARHSHEIVPPNTKLTGVLAKYNFKVLDESGIVVAERSGPSKSFLRNFGRLIRQIFLVTSGVNDQVTNTAGVGKQLQIISTANTNEGAVVPAGTQSPVFRIGDSGAAVDSSQHDIQGALLAESAPIISTLLVEDTAHIQWQVVGNSFNGTVSPWSVAEMVLCAQLRQGDLGGQINKVAMLRDVFAPVTVNAGSTAVATYIFNVPI